MDGDRFDALARAVGGGRSRRGLLKALGAAALGAAGLNREAEAASCTKAGQACGSTKPACCKGTTCANGYCLAVCTPNCDGKTCGPNGCGGSCGACSSGQSCCGDGTCADLTTTSNCGACGHACKAGQGCVNGKCVKGCAPRARLAARSPTAAAGP